MSDPVLVVGAGPVGLTLAMSLKRQGVDVKLIDKSAARSDKSKALVLWPRTLELLSIEGCVAPFIAAGMKAAGARIVADGKVVVHLTLETTRSEYRYALMLPQGDTERLLEQQFVSLGGAVQRGVELLSCVDDGDTVAATLRHADGMVETIRTAYLAGCDGAHSTVRHDLNVAFEGSTLPSEWLLADVQLEGDIPLDEMTICWASEGMLVFFPIAGRRFRVIADVIFATPTGANPPVLEDIQELVDSRGPSGIRLHDPIWLNRFRVNERKVKDYRHGRVFLAGDAAHVHSPAGGQGMNTGMQDAINLAWKLAMAIRDQTSARLLDSYSPERSAIGEQVLRNAGIMTKVAMLRNPALQQLRGLAAGTLIRIPALRQKMVDQLTEVDLHYGDGPLSVMRHAAQRLSSGDRAPNVAVRRLDDAVSDLYRELHSGTFVVLFVGVAALKLPETLSSLAIPVSAMGSAAYEHNHIFVIRPDAYVLMTVLGHQHATAFAQLERLRDKPQR